jgi:hypothetical protein
LRVAQHPVIARSAATQQSPARRVRQFPGREIAASLRATH